VWETEGELVYAFDFPGIPEEKINVELEDSTLTVSGSRERTEMEDGRLFRYERPFGEFTRSVALPEGTDDVEARAHYANGVLEVHVQKREQSKPRQIAVTTTVEGTSTD
jgi:HSP20 family protein